MRKLLLFSFLILSFSCKRFKDEKSFYTWLEEPGNSLVKTVENSKMKIKIKFLPPQFLAYNELKNCNYSKSVYDSVFASYSKSLTFLITFELKNKVDQTEMLMNNISSITEFKEKIEQLNFRMGELVSLKSGGVEHLPIGSTLENLYNIDNRKNVIVVFSCDDLEDKIDIALDDIVFDSGFQHFRFNYSDLKDIPSLDFLKFTS